MYRGLRGPYARFNMSDMQIFFNAFVTVFIVLLVITVRKKGCVVFVLLPNGLKVKLTFCLTKPLQTTFYHLSPGLLL